MRGLRGAAIVFIRRSPARVLSVHQAQSGAEKTELRRQTRRARAMAVQRHRSIGIARETMLRAQHMTKDRGLERRIVRNDAPSRIRRGVDKFIRNAGRPETKAGTVRGR